jgi:hypothetical protein
LQHAVVGNKADLTFDDLAKKVTTSKPIYMKGDHIHKSYLRYNQIFALSKGTTLQVWDINTSKQTY